MTKSADRRAIAGGCNARVFSQAAQTKSLNHKPRASANRGARPFIYRHIDVQRTTDFQTDGFASRY
jgi:hypothetical protein